MTELSLTERFPDLRPIRKAPTLMRMNGCGLGIYGRRDTDRETGTYVKTHCVCLLFVPVLAVGAYRVKPESEQFMNASYYFIGKVPVSAGWKFWNTLVLLVLAVLAATVAYDQSGIRQKADIARGDSARDEGQLVDAVGHYVDAGAGSDAEWARKARESLQELARSPSFEGLEGPARIEAWKTLLAAYRQLGGNPVELWDGVKTRIAAAEPIVALELLALMIDHAPDQTEGATLRRKLLEGALAASPNDPARRMALAVDLDLGDERDRAVALLTDLPLEAITGDAARILGQDLARRGQSDRAVDMLGPYVERGLAELARATAAYDAFCTDRSQKLLKALQNGKAPTEFYEQHRTLDEAGQRALVDAHIRRELEAHADYPRLAAELRRAARAVPAAIDLGTLHLQRGQSATDPAVRRRELERAEHVFLAMQSSAGDNDRAQLYLGQVYCWLGRTADADTQFDALLTRLERSFEALYAVAESKRGIGDQTAAVALMREAHDKAVTPAHRHGAAKLLGIMEDDLDARIAWLRKADPGDVQVQADLESAVGRQRIQHGDRDAGIRHLRAAIAIYAAQAPSAAMLNNQAILHVELHAETLDAGDLDAAIGLFDRAVALDPSSSLSLLNAADSSVRAAIADLAGEAIDLASTRPDLDVELLDHLFADAAGEEALRVRLNGHPRTAKARELLGRARILAPRHPQAVHHLYAISRITCDQANLDRLAGEVHSHPLDLEQFQTATLALYRPGPDDPVRRTLLATAIAGDRRRLEALRAKGGVNLAVVACGLVQRLVVAHMLGDEVEGDDLVALADLAHGAHASVATHMALRHALSTRASQQLAASHAGYGAFERAYRRSMRPADLIAWAASRDDVGAAVRTHSDVVHMIELTHELAQRAPNQASSWAWALLRAPHPELAAALATRLATDPHTLACQSIERAVFAANPSFAWREWWSCELSGKPEEGAAALARVRAAGIPMPPESR